MFGPSLKSVPGCLVSIVPMLIGVPVAATPGLGPHDEVLVDTGAAVAVLLALAELLAALVVALLALLLLELLLPHPARNTTPTNAATAKTGRMRGHSWYVLNVLSSSSNEPAPVWRVAVILVVTTDACKKYLTRLKRSQFEAAAA